MTAAHAVNTCVESSLEARQTQDARTFADFPQVAPLFAAFIDVDARRARRWVVLGIASGDDPVPATGAGIELAVVHHHRHHRGDGRIGAADPPAVLPSLPSLETKHAGR